jgi:hypothetical protein
MINFPMHGLRMEKINEKREEGDAELGGGGDEPSNENENSLNTGGSKSNNSIIAEKDN